MLALQGSVQLRPKEKRWEVPPAPHVHLNASWWQDLGLISLIAPGAVETTGATSVNHQKCRPRAHFPDKEAHFKHHPELSACGGAAAVTLTSLVCSLGQAGAYLACNVALGLR